MLTTANTKLLSRRTQQSDQKHEENGAAGPDEKTPAFKKAFDPKAR